MPQQLRNIEELLSKKAVVLGPMAGITDAPFRAICKRLGASLTYTEMVSAKGLHYNPQSRVSNSLLTVADQEEYCAVQLFGAEPEVLAEQAACVVERLGAQVALIDINMGCPVKKVVSKGEGCALMCDPDLAARIAGSVVGACKVPVTVKFRSGWDASSINAVDFARLMESVGVAAVTVHARTRGQFYQGHADWSLIAEVKKAVRIPVVGSGDVFSADDAVAMFERTGVDAVMVARGARGNPWLFREARSLLDFAERLDLPSPLERVDVAREHVASAVRAAGDEAVLRMRKHVAWYIFGLPGARQLRHELNVVKSPIDIDRLLLEYRASLANQAQ